MHAAAVLTIIFGLIYLNITDQLPASWVPWETAIICLYLGVRALYAVIVDVINENSYMSMGLMILVLPWGIGFTLLGGLGLLSLFGII